MVNFFSKIFTPRIPERRRYPRVRTSHLVKFFDPRFSSDVQVYNMADLSAGGIQLRCPERFRPDQYLNLLINLPEKNLQIAVLGKVVWSIPSKTDLKNFRIGVHFSAIGEDDRMKIRDYVRWAKGRLRFAAFAPIAVALFRLTGLALHPKIS